VEGSGVLPAGLHYAGPIALPDDWPTMVGEEDGRITTGDHVHLRLPFTNQASTTITNTTITLRGAPPSGSRPGVLLASATQDWFRTITYDLGNMAPGSTAYADVWIYVERIDPSMPRSSLRTGTYLEIMDGRGTRTVPIRVDEIQFPATDHADMTVSDCLHNPDDFKIAQYAQYAASYYSDTLPVDVIQDPNKYDPDTAEQTVRNVVTNVHEDFPWNVPQNTYDDRVEDTLLLGLRSGNMGECRHYADFTVGLLRSLGLPTRFVGGRFLQGGHAWAEVSVGDACSNGWSPADSTWSTAFDPGFYKRNDDIFGTFLWGWADLYPLSSALPVRIWPLLCDPSCYEDIDCDWCDTGSKTRWFDASCMESIRPCYHNVSRSHLLADQSSAFSITIQGPIYVTRSASFPLNTTVVNSATTTLDVITLTISLFQEISSTLPLYALDPPLQVITDLSPSAVVTVTWVVTPLLAGMNVPLEVIAISGDSATSFGQIQVVNEPGTPPPLILGGACGMGNVSPGQLITLTASVLDEMRQPITDTATTITATVYSTPTTGFSTTVNLTYCASCGHYQQVVNLPIDAPVGRYWVNYKANRPGYDTANTSNAFWVTPPVSVTLAANDSDLSPQSTLTLTVSVEDRGTIVTDASVWAAIATPSGTITVPLTYDGSDSYVVAFRVSGLAANLGGELPEGTWEVIATAEYWGGYGSDSLEITVHGAEATAASVEKSVMPQGLVNYSDELTYTVVISAEPGVQVALYDPLTDTTFLHFVEPVAGITPAYQTITGTLTVTPTNQVTVSFVVKVGIPGTAGWTVSVTNRACVYPVNGTIEDCVWSNEVENPAFRPYGIYLPLVLRSYVTP